jgi:hypothetical protein
MKIAKLLLIIVVVGTMLHFTRELLGYKVSSETLGEGWIANTVLQTLHMVFGAIIVLVLDTPPKIKVTHIRTMIANPDLN